MRGLGLAVLPGEANYLLSCAGRPVSAPLAERGILVRDCSDFDGLGAGWFRAAVRPKDVNDELIKALREALS